MSVSITPRYRGLYFLTIVQRLKYRVLICIYVLLRCAKDENLVERGWPNTAYGVSKLGMTVMSFIQQRTFNKYAQRDIVVNAVSGVAYWHRLV